MWVACIREEADRPSCVGVLRPHAVTTRAQDLPQLLDELLGLGIASHAPGSLAWCAAPMAGWVRCAAAVGGSCIGA